MSPSNKDDPNTNVDPHKGTAAAESGANPRCAYLYYVTPIKAKTGDIHADVKAYLMQENEIGANEKIEDLISQWAERVKAEELTPVGWALGDLRWRRSSYLVVLLNVPGAMFTSAEGLVITGSKHTIFDRNLIDVQTNDGSKMQAIYCRNHIVKCGGGKWNENDRPEKFDPLRLDLEPIDAAAAPIVTHDDVGTNLGPPRGGG
jgi:hypothetical protein